MEKGLGERQGGRGRESGDPETSATRETTLVDGGGDWSVKRVREGRRSRRPEPEVSSPEGMGTCGCPWCRDDCQKAKGRILRGVRFPETLRISTEPCTD